MVLGAPKLPSLWNLLIRKSMHFLNINNLVNNRQKQGMYFENSKTFWWHLAENLTLQKRSWNSYLLKIKQIKLWKALEKISYKGYPGNLVYWRNSTGLFLISGALLIWAISFKCLQLKYLYYLAHVSNDTAHKMRSRQTQRLDFSSFSSSN